MRSFIFLFCTVAFSLNSNNGFSQDADIYIDRDITISIEEIFVLIKEQAKCQFVYDVNMIKDAPDIPLKRGKIKASKLLKKGLNPVDCTFEFTNNTIIVKKKSLNTIRKEKRLQEVDISGTVKTENGRPIVGITVYASNVKPSNGETGKNFLIRGTSTDFDGSFSLSAKSGDYLVVSGIGYEFYTEQITASKTVYNITIKEQVSKLEEVVITGYSSTKRKDLTGSVGTLKGEQITQVKNVQTLDQTLAGQLSGVYVNTGSGALGAQATINIRGLSQLNGDNQPLYVVDGIPIVMNTQFRNPDGLGVTGRNENPLLAINPADIKSIDVLKDASAAALYGSRAANGVIVITTKRGQKNAPAQINVSYDTSISNPVNVLDVLSADEFRQFVVDNELDQPAGPQPWDPLGIVLRDANTDWVDLGTNNNALTQNYNVSVSGGTTNTNYLFSGRVSNQDGLIIGDKLTRYSFSANLDTDVATKLKVGFNISYNHSLNKGTNLDFTDLLYARPDIPVFNPDGSYSTYPRDPYDPPYRNALGDEAKTRTRGLAQNLLASVYGQYQIIKGLNFRSQFAVGVNNDRSSTFYPSFTNFAVLQTQWNGEPEGAISRVQNTRRRTINWTNTLNYNTVIAEDHTIDAVAGITYDYTRSDLDFNQYTGIADDDVLTDIGSAVRVSEFSSDATQNALNSLLGRVNYNYKNRYLLTLTGRYDGSIKFGPDSRFGFFPSVGAAWNAHNEPFLQGSNAINQLKLRASLGRTGTDALPSFSFVPTLGTGDSETRPVYDNRVGIIPTNVPNPNIRWETTDQLDLGVEFGLFNNRVTGEVVYFEKNTSDLILAVPVTVETGFTTWNANIADVSNKGWEITLGADIFRSKDFRWNSSFNISFVDNNVDALNGGVTGFGRSPGIREGYPQGIIEGYRVVGIAQTQEEIDALNNASDRGFYDGTLQQPGDYIFEDINGDGQITRQEDGLNILGNPNPDFFGGWNNTINYKSFDFYFNFNYVSGGDRLWVEGTNSLGLTYPFSNANVLTAAVTDVWSPDNTDARFARYGSGSHRATSTLQHDRSVYDASYIRLRSAGIGFNFPQDWLKDTGIRNVRLTLTGNNLFVISDYPGADPDVIGGSRGGVNDFTAIDRGAYPQSRTYTMGVQIGL